MSDHLAQERDLVPHYFTITTTDPRSLHDDSAICGPRNDAINSFEPHTCALSSRRSTFHYVSFRARPVDIWNLNNHLAALFRRRFFRRTADAAPIDFPTTTTTTSASPRRENPFRFDPEPLSRTTAGGAYGDRDLAQMSPRSVLFG